MKVEMNGSNLMWQLLFHYMLKFHQGQSSYFFWGLNTLLANLETFYYGAGLWASLLPWAREVLSKGAGEQRSRGKNSGGAREQRSRGEITQSVSPLLPRTPAPLLSSPLLLFIYTS
jgi:hypothetical protein